MKIELDDNATRILILIVLVVGCVVIICFAK